MVTAPTFKYTFPQDCYIFVQRFLNIMCVFIFSFFATYVFLNHVQRKTGMLIFDDFMFIKDNGKKREHYAEMNFSALVLVSPSRTRE